jgi:hypothetical protein
MGTWFSAGRTTSSLPQRPWALLLVVGEPPGLGRALGVPGFDPSDWVGSGRRRVTRINQERESP